MSDTLVPTNLVKVEERDGQKVYTLSGTGMLTAMVAPSLVLLVLMFLFSPEKNT